MIDDATLKFMLDNLLYVLPCVNNNNRTSLIEYKNLKLVIKHENKYGELEFNEILVHDMYDYTSFDKSLIIYNKDSYNNGNRSVTNDIIYYFEAEGKNGKLIRYDYSSLVDGCLRNLYNFQVITGRAINKTTDGKDPLFLIIVDVDIKYCNYEGEPTLIRNGVASLQKLIDDINIEIQTNLTYEEFTNTFTVQTKGNGFQYWFYTGVHWLASCYKPNLGKYEGIDILSGGHPATMPYSIKLQSMRGEDDIPELKYDDKMKQYRLYGRCTDYIVVNDSKIKELDRRLIAFMDKRELSNDMIIKQVNMNNANIYELDYPENILFNKDEYEEFVKDIDNDIVIHKYKYLVDLFRCVNKLDLTYIASYKTYANVIYIILNETDTKEEALFVSIYIMKLLWKDFSTNPNKHGEEIVRLINYNGYTGNPITIASALQIISQKGRAERYMTSKDYISKYKHYFKSDRNKDDISIYSSTTTNTIRSEKTQSLPESNYSFSNDSNSLVSYITNDGNEIKFNRNIPAIFDCYDISRWSDFYKNFCDITITNIDEVYKYIHCTHAFIGNGGHNPYYLTKNLVWNDNKSRKIIKYEKVQNIDKKMIIRYKNKNNKDQSILLDQLILNSRSKIFYEYEGFQPFGAKTNYDYNDHEIFNKFSGFNHKYNPDYIINTEVLSLFLNHIKEIWANNDGDIYNYIINWLAHIIQKPERKTGVLLILRSNEGAGKNILQRFISDYMIGKQYSLLTSRADDVIGKFNDLIINRILIVMDEMESTDRSKASSNTDKLKGFITEKDIVIEGKNKDKIEAVDYCNIMINTNNDFVISAKGAMRRFLMLDLNDKWCKNKKESIQYFSNMSKILYNNQAGETIINYLCEIDISHFNPNDLPTNKSKDEYRISGLEIPFKFLIDLIKKEYEWHYFDIENHDQCIQFKPMLLWDEFKKYQIDINTKYTYTKEGFYNQLKKVNLISKDRKLNGKNIKMYRFTINELSKEIANYLNLDIQIIFNNSDDN